MYKKNNMRFPGGKSKVLTLSYDDGVQQDVRIVEIFNKYNLKATFNINSNGLDDAGAKKEKVYTKGEYRGLAKEVVKELYNGHEIACHGYDHLKMSVEPTAKKMLEITKDRETLEELTGKMVRGMAYAYGDFNDEIVELLKGAGIEYSRTCMNTFDFSLPDDWLRLKSTCHHSYSKLTELAEKFVNESPRDGEASWFFYVWGHSYEFDRNNNWEIIENFAEKVSNKDDVWYATNIEVCDYLKAYDMLKYNIKADTVFNPTVYDLWFNISGENICVKPGETKKLYK